MTLTLVAKKHTDGSENYDITMRSCNGGMRLELDAGTEVEAEALLSELEQLLLRMGECPVSIQPTYRTTY